MRALPLILTIATVLMLITIGWRLTGGPLGPKSYAFIAATVVVMIAALMSWRRAPRSTTTTTTV
jgi:hypothetical protein